MKMLVVPDPSDRTATLMVASGNRTPGFCVIGMRLFQSKVLYVCGDPAIAPIGDITPKYQGEGHLIEVYGIVDRGKIIEGDHSG